MEKEKKYPKYPRVYMAKGGFDLNDIYISIHLYWELWETPEEAWIGRGEEFENKIIDAALKDKTFLSDIFGLDKRYFKNLYVYGDDCYDCELDDSYITSDPTWTYYKFLWGGYKDVIVDGEKYTVAIRVDREWFDGEEQKND